MTLTRKDITLSLFLLQYFVHARLNSVILLFSWNVNEKIVSTTVVLVCLEVIVLCSNRFKEV